MEKKELEKKLKRVRGEYDSFMRHELKISSDADTNVCRNYADDGKRDDRKSEEIRRTN